METGIILSKYDTFKKEVNDNYPIRKNLTFADIDINFEDENHKYGTITIEGKALPLTNSAFKSLLSTLGVNDTFIRKFTSIFGVKSKNQLVGVIKNKMSASNDKTVSMYIHPQTFKIVAITPVNKPYVSPDFYFNMVENVMSDNNLDVTNMNMDSTGNLSISTLNTGWGFDVDGLKDEAFNTGVIMTAGPTEDIAVDPHILRLICSNGMVGPRRLEMGPRLESSSIDDISKFMGELNGIQEHNRQFKSVFKDQVKKMNNINASYHEMVQLRDLVEAKVTDINDSRTEAVLEKYFPTRGVRKQYNEKGVYLSNLTKRHHKNTKTDMTTWELLNSLTDVASHDYGMGIGELAKADLKKQSGLYMFKKEFDTEFLVS
jgi:hypothetical protein